MACSNRDFRLKRSYLASFLAILILALAPPAQAQFTLEIGISRDKAVKRMVDLGYSQIRILRKGFKTINAEACLGGTRYSVRVADGYQVSNTGEIGVCRNTVTAASIERNLTNSGFTRIVIDRQNGNFIVLACRNQNRVRIIYSPQGEVLQRRQIGQCERIFQPNDVRKVLRDAGYDRIKFLDRQLPWYRAEACLQTRRLELLLTRFGEIRRSTTIGRCAPPLAPGEIASFMEDQGFTQIEILDNRLPVYKVTACQNDNRLEIDLDRYGQITSRERIGRCRQSFTEDEIASLLADEGFTRVRVNQRRNGNFEISACLEGMEKFATLSPFGKLLEERTGNRCQSRSVSELFERLDGRGFEELEFSAEGCRRGKRIRIYFDELGDRVRRETVGNC